MTLAATIAASVLAVLYAASPLTVLCGALAIVMCWPVVARLEGRERVWVRRVLIVTIGARFLVVGALLVATDPNREPFLTLFPDAAYLIDRSLWIRNVWLGIPLGAHHALQIVETYGSGSYPIMLAAIQYVLGPSPYGLALFSAIAYVAGALLLHRMVRARFGAAVSTAGLAIVLAWPSLFVWSVSALKDSFQFFLTVVAVAGLFYAVRGARWPMRAGAVIAVVAAVGVLATLRSGAAEIAATAIALAVLLRAMSAQHWIAVTMVIGMLAVALIERDQVLHVVRLAANRHVGYWGSPGANYQLLPDPFYANGQAVMTLTLFESVRFLARAAIAFVLVPLPWNTASATALLLVPQQLCWYLLVLASIAGVIAGARRDPWLTSILAASALAGLVVIAPNSGNVGTLVRHRDVIAPFVLWLGVIGAFAAIRAMSSSVSNSLVWHARPELVEGRAASSLVVRQAHHER